MTKVIEDKRTSPKAGDIAICSVGMLGLITVDEPKEITYADGNKGVAWTGIQLRDDKFLGRGADEGKLIQVKAGTPWSSRNPEIIGNICDFTDLIQFAIRVRDVAKLS